MGADARLLLFDYTVYRDQVAPAFIDFLRTGHANDWLLQMRRLYAEYWGLDEDCSPAWKPFVPIDLPAHCSYLDAQFGTVAPVANRDLYECTWEIRGCRSTTCAVRAHCPFLARPQSAPMTGGAVEDLLGLFQFAVARCCVGAGQFMGRSIDTFFYEPALDELGVSKDDPIRLLLERLGRRGFVVGYSWIVGTDGIHGWLCPEETADLSDRLFALNLPEYERSFAAMERFRSPQNLLEGRGIDLEFNVLTYNRPDVPFEQLSLSFVRTVCFLASREGKGVLWGNDFA